ETREHWTGPQNHMNELRLVVVTGLSGSGKSTAIKVLEDLGFYCIDNLPVALIPRFVEVWESSDEEVQRVALGLDVRERHFLDEFPRSSSKMRGNSSRKDRKSTRLNSSHVAISYAVFCLKKKKQNKRQSMSKYA